MIKREDIKYRIGTTSKPGASKKWATVLVYIDARTAQEELDEKFGSENWQYTWSSTPGHDFAIHGELRVKTEDGTWISREDVGYPQANKMKKKVDETEVLKDAVSDAQKRCAVQFGIGRFLYDAPNLWTQAVVTDAKGYVRKLDKLGEQEIEGRIDKWYAQIEKTLKEDK